MISLDKFKVEVVKESDNFTHIEVGPFPHGYGNTIGNSLRRLLLSSIPGAAIVGIKIKGVKHEYTALTGLKEDILNIVLNLKEIAVISHSDEIQVLKLNVKGKKGEARVVTAEDIELTGEVEIKNKKQVIATLADEKSSIEAEIYVGSGVGYALADESMRKEIGVIPLDAVYSPVKNVQMKIVPARVGQATDLDKIDLEITTNGTISGVDALLKASEIYDEVANRLVDMLGGDSIKAKEKIKSEEVAVEEKPKVLVADLGLSTRLTNSLLNAGITDLNQLEGKSMDFILNFRGMGKKSIDELIDTLEENNIKIK